MGGLDVEVTLEDNRYIESTEDVLIYGEEKGFRWYLKESLLWFLICTAQFWLLVIISEALLIAYGFDDSLTNLFTIEFFILWLLFVLVFGSIFIYRSNNYSHLYIINGDYVVEAETVLEPTDRMYSVNEAIDTLDLVEVDYDNETGLVEVKTVNESMSFNLPNENSIIYLQNRLYNL